MWTIMNTFLLFAVRALALLPADKSQHAARNEMNRNVMCESEIAACYYERVMQLTFRWQSGFSGGTCAFSRIVLFGIGLTQGCA